MKKPLKHKAYEYVLEKILSGALNPGERLSEVSMAREIGISPTPLREAYRQLASEGFVRYVPNSGTYVRGLDEREARELYETREALESYCAGKAALNMNSENISLLEECLEKQFSIARDLQASGREKLSTRDEVEYMKADVRFHFIILDSADNSIITKTMRECHVLGRLLSFNSHKHTLRQVATTLRHHSGIIKHIRERNALKAESRMRGHIIFSRQTALAGRIDGATPAGEETFR